MAGEMGVLNQVNVKLSIGNAVIVLYGVLVALLTTSVLIATEHSYTTTVRAISVCFSVALSIALALLSIIGIVMFCSCLAKCCGPSDYDEV